MQNCGVYLKTRLKEGSRVSGIKSVDMEWHMEWPLLKRLHCFVRLCYFCIFSENTLVSTVLKKATSSTEASTFLGRSFVLTSLVRTFSPILGICNGMLSVQQAAFDFAWLYFRDLFCNISTVLFNSFRALGRRRLLHLCSVWPSELGGQRESMAKEGS